MYAWLRKKYPQGRKDGRYHGVQVPKFARGSEWVRMCMIRDPYEQAYSRWCFANSREKFQVPFIEFYEQIIKLRREFMEKHPCYLYKADHLHTRFKIQNEFIRWADINKILYYEELPSCLPHKRKTPNKHPDGFWAVAESGWCEVVEELYAEDFAHPAFERYRRTNV